MKKTRLFGALLVCSMLIAGCGSKKKDPTSTPDPAGPDWSAEEKTL